MKTMLRFILLIIATFAFFSCQKIPVNPIESNSNRSTESLVPAPSANPDLILGRTTQCLPTEVMLVAGQTINAGTVTVTNDSNFIYVTYTTANGWYLTQTHLYVGDCALIPVNNQGNPIPGHFPYAGTHTNITSYTYQVPISRIPAGGCGCIAAHAVVVRLNGTGQVIEQQTGWGQGTLINPNGGNWAMKFDYCSCTPSP